MAGAAAAAAAAGAGRCEQVEEHERQAHGTAQQRGEAGVESVGLRVGKGHTHVVLVSNIVKKLTVLPPKIHRFSAIPVKLPMALFTELRQKNLIIFMEMQNSLGNQSNLETEKQSGRNQAP